MKQHITGKQVRELSEKAREKLREWWKPEDGDRLTYLFVNQYREDDKGTWEDFIVYDDDEYCFFDYQDKKCSNSYTLPRLSIGQMIEFLGNDYWKVIADDWTSDKYVGIEWGTGIDDFKSPKPEELADALWEKVKNVLEEKI